MPRRLLVCLALAPLLAGCANLSLETVAEYRPCEGTQPLRKARAGRYALYRRGEERPMEEYEMRHGEKVGFERTHDGRLLAWGGVEVGLDEGEYFWQRLPATRAQAARYALDDAGNCLVDASFKVASGVLHVTLLVAWVGLGALAGGGR